MGMKRVYLGDYAFQKHDGMDGYYPDMYQIENIMREKPTLGEEAINQTLLFISDWTDKGRDEMNTEHLGESWDDIELMLKLLKEAKIRGEVYSFGSLLLKRIKRLYKSYEASEKVEKKIWSDLDKATKKTENTRVRFSTILKLEKWSKEKLEEVYDSKEILEERRVHIVNALKRFIAGPLQDALDRNTEKALKKHRLVLREVEFSLDNEVLSNEDISGIKEMITSVESSYVADLLRKEIRKIKSKMSKYLTEAEKEIEDRIMKLEDMEDKIKSFRDKITSTSGADLKALEEEISAMERDPDYASYKSELAEYRLLLEKAKLSFEKEQLRRQKNEEIQDAKDRKLVVKDLVDRVNRAEKDEELEMLAFRIGQLLGDPKFLKEYARQLGKLQNMIEEKYSFMHQGMRYLRGLFTKGKKDTQVRTASRMLKDLNREISELKRSLSY